MEIWQVWLITILCLLLAFTLIIVSVYLTFLLKTVKKALTIFEGQIGSIKPIIDFFAGVEKAKKQAHQNEEENLRNSCSFETGQLLTDLALTGLTLWKTLWKRRRS